MIPIQEELLTVNRFSRTGKPLKQAKAIVMHYTASPGAPAKNIRNYFQQLGQQNPNDDDDDRYAGAHFSVDRTTIVQAIPDLEMAYHVGSKSYTPEAASKLSAYPNDCTIGIEMCIEKDGSIHPQTFQNSVDLAAHLMIKHKIPKDQIWTHKAVVGWKDCPLPWIQKPAEFDRFKQEVYAKVYPASAKPDCEVWVNGKQTNVPGKAISGEAYVGVRAMAELLDVSFQYQDQNKKMIVNGVETKSFIVESGTGFIKAREWGHITGMKLRWAGQAMDIELFK